MAWILIEAALATLLLVGLMIWTLRDTWTSERPKESSESLEELTAQNAESPHQRPHHPH